MAESNKKRRGPRPDPDSKRSRGVSRNLQPRKSFHAEPELFKAMETYLLATKPQPTESAVIRLAIEEFLASRGFWPPKK